MSWFAKNYEKAALGGTLVIAFGVAYMGWSKYTAVDDDFATVLKGSGNTNAAVKSADLIPKAVSSLKLDRSWTQATVGDRPVDLFTGIALYVSAKDPEKPIDPLGDGEQIHPPVPNIWWIENRIDPGFGDSPSRDPDLDGFTNLEEYEAKTDPNAAKSHPPLIQKLMYIRDESLAWVIRPGYGSEGKFDFKYLDSMKRENKTGSANLVAPGELFFGAGVQQGRFKLLGSETRRQFNESTKIETDVNIVRIEDQSKNKMGTIYEFPAPLSPQLAPKYTKYDRTAILSLEALGMSGNEIKVEENMTFALPPTAAKKEYKVKEVTPESVTIDYPAADGQTKTVKITKGNMGVFED
jgi:hypothetical protein